MRKKILKGIAIVMGVFCLALAHSEATFKSQNLEPLEAISFKGINFCQIFT